MKYIKAILPSPAVFVSLFIAPLLLTLYFVLTRYSDRFLATQGVDYEAIQDNVLAVFFISGEWAQWLTRFMDFAFWGVLALIAILIAWGISVARTTVENHVTEQSFYNFKTAQKDWHGNFVMVTIIKVLLLLVMVYSVFQLIARAVPQLAAGIGSIVVEGVSADSVLQVTLGALLIVALQLLFVMAYKMFKITQID